MTDKQPEALRLAEHLEAFRSFPADQAAAAELRRLHEVNAELVEALEYVIKGVPSTWVGVVKAQTILEKTKEENNG